MGFLHRTRLLRPGPATSFLFLRGGWGLPFPFGGLLVLLQQTEQPLQEAHHEEDDDEHDLLQIRRSQEMSVGKEKVHETDSDWGGGKQSGGLPRSPLQSSASG